MTVRVAGERCLLFTLFSACQALLNSRLNAQFKA